MSEINKSCFFTGHRVIPAKSKMPLKTTVREQCVKLIQEYGVTDFIAGGALGFDMLAEEIVISLKKNYPNIKLHLYLPCRDQSAKWKEWDIDRYDSIMEQADECIYITEGIYTEGCMKKRNIAMVDAAYFGIAYYTGKRRSGTYSTINYASEKKRDVLVINVYEKKPHHN